MKKIKKGFTLIELLIVVVILAILGTMAVLSSKNNLVLSRNATRLLDISTLQTGMEDYFKKNAEYLMPENYTTTQFKGKNITFQGEFIDDSVDYLNIGGMKLDPYDETFYNYSLTNDKQKYQIIGFFENIKNEKNDLLLEKTIDINGRVVKLFGTDVGIFTNSINNDPVTKNEEEFIDIENVVGKNLYLAENKIISNAGKMLDILPNLSCKRLRDLGKHKSGIYSINPAGKAEIKAYCDMVSSGGGWTMITAQFENSAVAWEKGLEADYDPSLRTGKSFSFKTDELPAGTLQVALGKGLEATYAGYFNFEYKGGNIAEIEVSDMKNNRVGKVFKDENVFYFKNFFDNQIMWEFSPNKTPNEARGGKLLGEDLSNSNENFAWTIWVR